MSKMKSKIYKLVTSRAKSAYLSVTRVMESDTLWILIIAIHQILSMSSLLLTVIVFNVFNALLVILVVHVVILARRLTLLFLFLFLSLLLR